MAAATPKFDHQEYTKTLRLSKDAVPSLPMTIDLMVEAAITRHLGPRVNQMGPGMPVNTAQVAGPTPKQVYILPLASDEARSMMKGVDEAYGRWRGAHEKVVGLPPNSPDYLGAVQELFGCWMDYVGAADRFVQFMRPT